MYCGEKVRLRAYKEEDIPLATKFVNDRELKKLLVTNIPFPMTNWEEESWIKSQKSNDNGQYNFAIEDIETGELIQEGTLYCARLMNHMEDGIYTAHDEMIQLEVKVKNIETKVKVLEDNLINNMPHNNFLEDLSTLDDIVINDGIYNKTLAKVYY